MPHDIVIRFSDEQAAALAARKKTTLVSVSAFVRRAVDRELSRPVIDAEPESAIERRSASVTPVLFTPRPQEPTE